MSATIERQAAAAVPAPRGPVVLPQVNLLPPEIRAKRSLSRVKRLLAASLVLVLVLLAGGYALAVMDNSAADDELAEAQAETARLQAQESTYGDVPAVLNAVTSTQDARTFAMASEIRWKSYLDAITAVLPAGVSIDQFTLTGPASSTTATSVASAVDQGIGTIAFEGRSKTVPDTAAWLDALASVTGFQNPWVSTVTVTEEDGSTYYSISSTVQLTTDSFALRFVPTEETN